MYMCVCVCVPGLDMRTCCTVQGQRAGMLKGSWLFIQYSACYRGIEIIARLQKQAVHHAGGVSLL